MALLFGREWTKSKLLRRIGRLSQVGGIRLYELSDGSARGMRVAEVRTGSGLAFNVLLDRAMDIGTAEFAGYPLCWQSCTGFAHPAFFVPRESEWLRTFGGGLLTTCGLQNVGAPNIDSGKTLNLHGGITATPAENVNVAQKWSGDNLEFSIEGTMHETAVFGPNLALHRLIWTRLGEKKIFIEDRITNEGFEHSPLMILYHINIGWPLLDDDTILMMPSRKVIPRDAEAEKGKENYGAFHAPKRGYREKVYFHDMIANALGNIIIAVINPKLNKGGIGLYIKYPQAKLPRLTEWKMMGEGTYVLGIEPGNCGVLGRASEREAETLHFIAPGETHTFHLEIGVISTSEEFTQIGEQIKNALEEH